MKRNKYKWILTSSGDFLDLKERLNALAAQGWELEKAGDGGALFARFRETGRTELRYDVEVPPFLRDASRLEHDVEERQRAGWEPVGTINGLDVYASMPCQTPEECRKMTENNRNWLPRGVITLILLIGIILLCWMGSNSKEWYLNHLTAFLRCSRVPVTLFGTIWSLKTILQMIKPPKKAGKPFFFWLKSAGFAGFLLWLVLLWLVLILTLIPEIWGVGMAILSLILLTLFLMLRSRRGYLRGSVLALLIGSLLLLSVGLSAIVEKPYRYSMGSAPWRYSLTNVTRREEFTDEESEFISAEYQKKASLLVQKESYEEDWADMRIISEHYSCLTNGLAQLVESESAHSGGELTREGRAVHVVRIIER